MPGSDGKVELPKDAAYLPQFPIQWWYWSGHLASGETPYGFEVVFFAADQPDGSVAQSVNFGLTRGGAAPRFFHQVAAAEGAPAILLGAYDLSLADGAYAARGEGRTGAATLHAAAPDGSVALDLAIGPCPAAIHFGGDLHSFTFGGNTYYYSRELQPAKGTLVLEGVSFPVAGTSWFDRQYGDLAPVLGQKYEWMALQLDDGPQVMLCDFYREGSRVDSFGSVTSGASTRDLGPDAFTVKPLAEWTSPDSGCLYPMGWEITLDLAPRRTLIVEPVLLDQEFPAPSPYWEGDCIVRGDATGRAYVEMHGLCPAADPCTDSRADRSD